MIANKYTILLGLACIICSIALVQSQMVGGLDQEQPADAIVRNVMSNVQQEIRKQFPREIESIEPISYRRQMVAGMNYFIKALVTEKDSKKSTAHLRVWKKFNNEHELTALKADVDELSELKYFQ